MLVAGASRHAKEVLELLYVQQLAEGLLFFDDVNVNGPKHFYGKFPIVNHLADLADVFKSDNRFILGLGGTQARAIVAKKLLNYLAIQHRFLFYLNGPYPKLLKMSGL